MELATKHAIRIHLKKVRKESQPYVSIPTITQFSHTIYTTLQQITNANPATIAGYYPIQSEFNILPVLTQLQTAGHTVALPIAVKKRTPLLFRQFTNNENMERDIYKTPIPGSHMPYVTPDILLIPMLGFTEQGYRMGYGGGFYDITILEMQ